MSTTATALRVGSIWRKGDREAMVLVVGEDKARLRAIVNGKLGRHWWVPLSGGQPGGYTFVAQQPTLTCVDEVAAEVAAALLHNQGVSPDCAFAIGRVVVVSMTPPSVLRFADDAFEGGWATDEDCARMIGDLG